MSAFRLKWVCCSFVVINTLSKICAVACNNKNYYYYYDYNYTSNRRPGVCSAIPE